MTTNVDQIKAALLKPRGRKKPVKSSDLLSTGSTILNLACTGNVRGGFLKGYYYYMVGDSVSGKTWLVLSCLAEASINRHFDRHCFVYDGVEYGALMDIKKYFGAALAGRMEPPAVDEEGAPLYSQTIEDFYFNVDDAFCDGRPFIYVLDSMDALSSDYEGKKFDERKKAARADGRAKGDYGDGKAKINSGGIRRIVSRLHESESILIVVGQTRDNVGGGMFDPRKVHAGGHALKFYATLQLWSSKAGVLTRTVRGKERQVGIKARVAVKKNRITGRERMVVIKILHASGIDDVGDCVDYLVEEGHWEKAKSGLITAGDFDLMGKREAVVQRIEEGGLEMDLRGVVSDVWHSIDDACAVKRKSRYAKENEDARAVEEKG